ncbi:MAG: 30S ribosomal protein S2 [Candidatus Dadabacteria bacterium]|nr:MAG: 30S ribosomal protein S2 [Candidatus Dadabacteria bacterium]
MSFNLSIQQLLESGAHYGHQASRWDPRMRPFIYGQRNNVHIINLAMTMAYAEEAYEAIANAVASGQGVLFVGTKPQAREPVREAALRANQYFMVNRWLGGTLTNLRTMRKSVEKIQKIQKMEEDGTFQLMTKKEALSATRERDKLLANLEGIMEMKRLPGAVFVVDIGHDHIAVNEATRLNIPVIGLCDTNRNPGMVDYPVPANDDAVRSIRLFANLFAEACIDGEQRRQEKLRSEEEEAVAGESLADSFIDADEEEELLTMRTVIKKVKKSDDQPAAAAEARAEEPADAAEGGDEAAEAPVAAEAPAEETAE